MTSSAPIKGIDQDTAQQLADLFKTLGDPTRLKILSLLAAEQELRVYDGLTMGQSAISHQLRVLRTSRLVKFRREGKEVLYALDDDHVLKLLGQGLEHVQHE